MNKTVVRALTCLLCIAQLPSQADQAKWKQLYEEGNNAYLNDKWDVAEPLLRKALKECEPQSVNYAKTETSLALVLENLNLYTEALSELTDALAIFRKKTGEESEDTTEAKCSLATFFVLCQRYADAEPLYLEILNARKKHFGINSAKTADAMDDLAYVYGNQNRAAEADSLANQGLSIRTKLFGRDNPTTAKSLTLIGTLLGWQRRYADAEAPYKEALAIYKHAYGEENVHAIRALKNLASLYRVSGRKDEAQACLDKIAALDKKRGTAAGARDLYVQGKLCTNQGRYAEAEPIFRAYQKLADKPLPNTLVFKKRAYEQIELMLSLCTDLHLQDLVSFEQKITGDASPKAIEYEQEKSMSSFERFRLQLALLKYGIANPDKNIVRALLRTIDMSGEKNFDSDSLVTSQAFLFTIHRFATLDRRSFEMCRQTARQYLEFADESLSEKGPKRLSLKTMILNGKEGTVESNRLSQNTWNSEPVAVEYFVRSLLSLAFFCGDLDEGGDVLGREYAGKLNSVTSRVIQHFLPVLGSEKGCNLFIDAAESCKMQGDYAQAKSLLSKILAMESGSLNSAAELIRARALVSLVDVNLQECNYDAVLRAGQEALALPAMSKQEMSAQRAAVLGNMAQAAIQINPDQSVKYAEEAISVLKSGTADNGSVFNAKLTYAKCLIGAGQSNSAIRLLETMKPRSDLSENQSAYILNWSIQAEICALTGDAQLANHNYADAKLNYGKALDVHRQSRTKYSIMQQVDDSFNIAICDANLGDHEAATSLSGIAANQLMKYSEEVFPNLSFAEQRSFAQQLNYYSSLLVALRHSDAEIDSTFGYLIQWRGLLVKALRRQSLMADQSHDAQATPLMNKWRELKHEIVNLANSSDNADPELKAKVARYSEEKENLERQLLAGTANGGDDPVKDVTAKSFMNRLKQDEAYIELSSYQPLNSTSVHYYAIVATPSSLKFVDIPDADRINSALQAWRQTGMYKPLESRSKRNQKLAKSSGGNSFRDLRFDAAQSVDNSSSNSLNTLQQRLWNPILSVLPESVNRIVLCDDGELSRLPWEMLVDENSKGRQFLTMRVDSPREFLGFRSAETSQPTGKKPDSVLLVGAIDYQNSALQLAGTGKEIAAINALFADKTRSQSNEKEPATAPNVIMLTSRQPTPGKIKSLLPTVSIAHLATHGFFAASTKSDNSPSLHRAVRMNSTALGDAVAVRNPLVASGILLASATPRQASSVATSDSANASDSGMTTKTPGSNAVSTKNGDIRISDEGELTAEELVELNLNKCQLIVLSACETGRGTEERGQGVLGLRSVLMAAGSKSVLISLWSVDDEATSYLMTEFYKQLLNGKSEAESLQIAKDAVRNNPDHPQWKAPCYWAAWALVGQGW